MHDLDRNTPKLQFVGADLLKSTLLRPSKSTGLPAMPHIVEADTRKIATRDSGCTPVRTVDGLSKRPPASHDSQIPAHFPKQFHEPVW
jgi:hypothetical protein